jgi:hypothetical protein
MNKIKFAGIEGEVNQTSPHGNFLVVKLSDRVCICGTFNNAFHWQESPDASSGFASFITYIGMDSEQEAEEFVEWAIANDGYFNHDDNIPRSAKRVQAYKLEIKVRGLAPKSVVELINR